MILGGEDKRISEPIAIQTQFMSGPTSRFGLGHQEVEETGQKERFELHLKAMAMMASSGVGCLWSGGAWANYYSLCF